MSQEKENIIKQENDTKQKKEKKNNTRRNLVIIFMVIVTLVGYIMFRGTFLEFSEIGENFEEVFWKNTIYKSAVMGVNFVFLFIMIICTNRGIKKGLKTFFEQEKKNIPKLPNKSIAFVLSIVITVVMANILTQKVMLMINNASFGITDPIFNHDIGYFVFQKPFIQLVLLYLAGIMVGLTIYIAVYYIITFNFYFDGIDRNELRQSKMIKQILTNIKIISIFLAAITLINTENIVFEKMITLKDELSTVIYGAGIAAVTIKLWGYRILSVVIILAVFMATKYFKEKQTKKIIISLISVPIYLVCLFLIMIGFQLLYVKSNELDREKQYIAYNIENTKNAYNINVEEKDIENNGTISMDEINNNKDVIDNIALVSKNITLTTLQDKQTSSKYYTYRNSQIGNYNINGKNKLVYISPREIVSGNSVTYNNKTYEYTHGFGNVITSAVSTDKTGNLEYIQKSFDGSDDKIEINQPRIYFGMQTNESVVTNSKNKTEFDYPKSESENEENIYDGNAGLELGFLDRIVLAIKQGNMKLVFSGEITDDSKILINRNIIERAEKIMPDIIYDQNPYQVITEEGKLVWVIDGYTVSNEYPYSQTTVIERNGTKQKINYIRNSVKVLVDSYDGTVKFYITDRTDPIIMAYRNIYEDLFQDIDENIPEDIANHFVYPEYIYNIQANMLERYHNVRTDVLYRNNDVWDRATHTTSKTLKTTGTPMNPYYTMVKTVDSDSAELGLVLPYTMFEKQSLISYLVGTTESDGNSKLTLYKFSNDSNMFGPMQLDTQIEQDEEISKTIKSLNVTGTKIIRNMIIVPIENTLLYIEPIYQVMLNESEVPVLKKVIVASGNKVAIGNNLQEALINLSSQYAIDIEVSNTENLDGLINAIVKGNQNLQKSNANGDWEMIGKDMQTLNNLIVKLEELLEEKKKEEKDNEKYIDVDIDSILNNGINENISVSY